MESARVVFLVRKMPTQCPLHIGEVSWKYLKGFQSYGPHKILQFWETMGDNSWTKSVRVVILACDTPTNALCNLIKFHENSSKGIGVMGRTRFHLQTDRRTDGKRDRQTPGQSLYPRTFWSGDNKTLWHYLNRKWICDCLLPNIAKLWYILVWYILFQKLEMKISL